MRDLKTLVYDELKIIRKTKLNRDQTKIRIQKFCIKHSVTVHQISEIAQPKINAYLIGGIVICVLAFISVMSLILLRIGLGIIPTVILVIFAVNLIQTGTNLKNILKYANVDLLDS